ncbi:MAG TPA: M1 family aminopeptidase [Terriglobales bacterium]|nr:M1 family aminopeptidase [Terriglobales bacterium]
MSAARCGKRTRAGALVFLISAAALTAENTPQDSYRLKVRIDPASENIAVAATVETTRVTAGNVKFTLHETLAIKKLEVNGKAATFTEQAIVASPMVPAAKTVTVTVPESMARGRVRMDIEYEGRLKHFPEWNAAPQGTVSLDDQVNTRMIELAGYSSWYPQFVFGEPIAVEFEVSLPAGWTAICSGRKVEEMTPGDRVITRWSSPQDIDVLVAASPKYRKTSLRESGVSVEIYDTAMPRDFLAREGEQIVQVLKLYEGTMGKTSIPGDTVRHVYSPKQRGQGKAGIARAGLIVTSEGLTLESLKADPNFSLFQPIAHEIAHFWWNFGTEQGDWINEAFAEYFSAVAVQKIASEKDFKDVLNDYENQVRSLPSDAPSIASVAFQPGGSSYVVRYFKGALMLHSFRASLGDQAFFGACREFFIQYHGRPTGTADFRSFWESKLGSRKNLLSLWMDSPGGLPNPGQ